MRTLGQLSDTRKNNFDFLRFFFASLVIFSHSFLLLTPNGNEIEPLSQATEMKLNFGSLAVACFFAISGFLITQSWLRSASAQVYFEKRVLRIYPGWIVALLFCILVVAPLLSPHHHFAFVSKSTFGFLGQLLLYKTGILKTLTNLGPVNGSTWTIPFEILCYVLVAVIGLAGLLPRRGIVLGLGLALLVFINWPTRTLLPTFGPTTPGFHIPYLGWLRCLPLFTVYFLSGMLYFLFRDRIPHSPWLLAFSVVLAGLTLFHAPLAPLFFVILPTFGFYILFYLAFLPQLKLHDFARRGDFSYGVYLYAYPLQRVLIGEQFHGYRLTPLTLFITAWLLACSAAILSWHFVEKPFLKLKPKPQTAPQERSPVTAVI